jgi:protein TonB
MDSPTGTVEVELVGPSPDAEGPPSGNLASMPLQTEQLSLPKPAKKLSSSRPASAPASPHSSSPGVVGESTGRLLGKPAYIVKPSAAYPAESRALGEEGTVVLRITINATGRPTNIRVLASSGFSRLDRAAIEAGWRCRIRNANAGDQFDAPLLFRLQNPR